MKPSRFCSRRLPPVSAAVGLTLAAIAGCSSVGIGIGIPIGVGGVSVGIGSDGTVSGGIGVGSGGVSVGVGGSTRLPPPQAPASAASAAH